MRLTFKAGIGLLLAVGLSAQQRQFNYAEALQKSIFFYEAQRSGALPANNRVKWRGDSALEDGKDVNVDLTGGWYDAGDHVKFGFPMAGATTLLAWGALEYPNAFAESRQMAAMLEGLRWSTDYLLKASEIPNQLWGQVGNGELDHAFWGSAEVLPMARPSFKISSTCPGSDLAGETAAALAASSLVFRAQGDAEYADKLLARAKSLYKFADTYRGKYSDCIANAAGFYQSFSGYQDELAWGAAWLFKATNDAEYLGLATNAYRQLGREAGTQYRSYKWTHGWDDKSYGAGVLLAQLTGQTEFRDDTERWLDYWTSGYSGQRVAYTPGGLAWLDQWGSLRYSANTAFLSFVYSDWLQSKNLDPVRAARYVAFAERQINYMLGDNPRRGSYVVGFGNNPPRNPHHRTAHGAWGNDITTPAVTTHTLFGALVGGPDAADGYADSRTDYVRNEVALDYNAAFTGALARMYRTFGGSPLPTFPAPEVPTRDELFAEASINVRGNNFVEVSAYLNNQSSWPARVVKDLSLRYFFTLDSAAAGDITLTTAFNQCGPATGPVRWAGQVYYVQVSCADQPLSPSGVSASRRQTQFRITTRGDWNPENDWSYTGLPAPGQGLLRSSRIVLYDGAKKVWGDEPPTGPPQPLAIAIPPELGDATAGKPYRAKLEAAGGAAPYVKWEVTSGQLPDGLTLDLAKGEITGVPTTEGAQSFEVSVTDSSLATASQQFILSVKSAGPLSLTTRALSRGFVGVAYFVSLQAEGGVPPYRWTIAEGEPPAGLTIDGSTIAGTPSGQGSSALVLKVTDAKGTEATRTLNLTIDPAPSPADSLLRVQYRTNFADPRINQLGPVFRIANTATGDVPLSELTLRYYFTLEEPKPLNYWCDWAMAGCDNVRGKFVDLGDGKFYLELSFKVSAGLIRSGDSSGEIQSRLSKEDWTFFDQSNDYSFDGSKNAFADWDRVALYRNGVLVWGVEP